tara:strand:- start:4323 stop:5681 length:1359 start_codon:yes stop_codon:yes gene_type:complete
MKDEKIKILLCAFGSGSKLLQAHLSNSYKLFTLPAYPLLYFPIYFNIWLKDHKLNSKKLFSLLEIQFKSIFDTREILGFNGTNQLGKNKKNFIKISKKKFKNHFIKFFEKKKINLKNSIIGIHQAYIYSINKNDSQILYHPHSLDIYKKYLYKNFINSKTLLTIRNPILNFWRSAHADTSIDKIRFDTTDYENLRNYRYVNRLRDIYLNFSSFDKNLIRFRLFKFEELKQNKEKSLKKICKYFKIHFDKHKILTPKFGNKIWWGSKIYKGSKEKYLVKNLNNSQIEDQRNFYKFEKMILEQALLPFLIKFGYKKKNKTYLNQILFWVYIFFPTKYGLTLFLSRLNIFNLILYFKNCIKEFSSIKLKNYYFNAMYKFKWSYSIAFLLKNNFVRKKCFYSKNNFFWNLINLLIKLFLYPIFQLELLIMYFFRIYLLIRIKQIISKNIIFMKILK